MHKAQEVIGLSVIDVSSGQRVGEVRDLLFDHDWMLRGVLLEPIGLMRRGLYIPSENILSIGKDALTIADEKAVITLTPSHGYYALLNGEQKLKGKSVITTTGTELGQVEDVYFHAEVGRLMGYELTDGFLSDVLEGRKILPFQEQINSGDHAIIVPHGMENMLKGTIEE